MLSSSVSKLSYKNKSGVQAKEIIEEGNSFKPLTSVSTVDGKEETVVQTSSVTAEEKLQKKNEVKARSLLMMTIPNDELLNFSKYKDAKSLFEAITTRYGGNEATKKTQKTLLKQNFENFSATSNESLDHISSTGNMAFVSSPSNSSPDEVKVAVGVSTANPSNDGSMLTHEDLQEINDDDLEEMDLKWQISLLSMRAKKFYQRTGKKININSNDTAGFDKSKSFMADEEEAPAEMALMAFSDSEVLSAKSCSKTCTALKEYEALKKHYDEQRIELNQTNYNLSNHKRGLAILEEQIVHYKNNESIFAEDIAVLKRDLSLKNAEINLLKAELDRITKAKDN
ncbi:hypothetical protein Tco_0981607 [Tanacetum coccineum]